MKNIFFTALWVYFFVGVGRGYSDQDPDKPDLRKDSSCNICRGNSNNYSILSAYFSDDSGTPSEICENSGEPIYVSVLYSSNSNSSIHNVRIMADILKRNRDDLDADPISQYYINEFIGTVNPCQDGTCVFSIRLPEDFVAECVNEFYELSETMIVWTPNNNNDLENQYTCRSQGQGQGQGQGYSQGQCLDQQTFLIEVGALTYSFEPLFDCLSGGHDRTNVSFVLTSLFGGDPLSDYSLEWVFSFSEGPDQVSADFSPTLLNREEGELINVSLTVTQASISGDEVTETITVPSTLGFNDIIDDFEIIQADEGMSNGVIDVEFLDKDLFYFWTSLEDDSFYSEDSRIEDLPVGTYELRTIDFETGTCRVDLFDVGFQILPVELTFQRAQFDPQTRTSHITWATAKEWESSHFEIERANEGTDFEKIGEIGAKGWSDVVTEYKFEDKDIPLAAKTMLYRIRKVGFNEDVVYSSAMSLHIPAVVATKGVWRGYPNPTYGDRFQIGLVDKSQYAEENISFRLILPNRKSQALTVSSEAEMNEALANMIGQISKGVFIVEIRWGSKIEYIKVLNL